MDEHHIEGALNYVTGSVADEAGMPGDAEKITGANQTVVGNMNNLQSGQSK